MDQAKTRAMKGQNLGSGLFTSDSMEWETPPDLFKFYDDIYHFTLDVCASPINAKCDRYYTLKDGSLAAPWHGEVCWMNPPYGSEIVDWVRKAARQSKGGATIVALLPARTDNEWWHEWVAPYAHIDFLRGRVPFIKPDWLPTRKKDGTIKTPTGAPFPSAVAIYRPNSWQSQRISFVDWRAMVTNRADLWEEYVQSSFGESV